MNLKDLTYVVFDTETTGLNPKEGEELIEIGAVKIKDGKIFDRFDELIKPTKLISEKITSITNITNEMVKNSDDELTVLKRFLDWVGNDTILVAHNANFDLSFMKMAYLKYDLGFFNYTVIDTLGISRFLEPSERYHNLTVLMERYQVEWDENKHHRADYDAEGTALVLDKLINKLHDKNINTLDELYLIPRIIINKHK
ncbi:MAG: 3'-5' exoribonuclease [Bacilli bacterium]|nr:3'-5' exoribonuclease [Bacilli bacterium]